MKPKLTAIEFNAVRAFLKAVRELPASICISVEDPADGYGTLFVRKRITTGMAEVVATVNKKSLYF